jgi:hypothetical protein
VKIIALISVLFAAACIVEPPPPTPPSGNGADASLGGASPDAPGSASTCVAPATPPGDGHHNPGQNCLGCHTGNGAPKWYAAGTLYDSSGNSPLAGATVTLVDSTGKTVKIVTAQNGNFWTPEALTPPLHPKASRCPAAAAMSGNATGACNSCHTSGGSPGRIKLQ